MSLKLVASSIVCFTGLMLLMAQAQAGSRDPTIDALFYSISPAKNQQLEDNLDAYVGIGTHAAEGAKYRSSCHIGGGRTLLEFGPLLGGTFIKQELSKADVWKAIAGDQKAMTRLDHALTRARSTPNLYLPDGVDQMIAYAAQPDGRVKFWGIAPGGDHFLQAESPSPALRDIAPPLCALAGKLGLNHGW